MGIVEICRMCKLFILIQGVLHFTLRWADTHSAILEVHFFFLRLELNNTTSKACGFWKLLNYQIHEISALPNSSGYTTSNFPF